ncbi:soluble scavenger receptor cysteine-rich domain-containing protein SSC5D-like [Halichondria panicea]|uniref:soluble scavenger receptor cysteine-rich domain-containing protein SSC5D-like n=1 Tax=Halichondria panicea TaxID=6063 RepID=UPI00312B9017
MNCLLWKSVTFLSLVWAVRGQSQVNGDLRLVGNSGLTGVSSGRLEVYYSGQWGTVCDDSFGSNDARVACRQLGFSTYTQYGQVGTLGFSQASSTTQTWLDNLGCLGTESRLINCPANTIGFEDCSHFEDIALICTENSSSGDLRLVSSSSLTGGRLEVYYSGQWGTVCDDSFGLSDARVACRQLGYTTYNRYGTVGTLGFSEASSTTPIWLDELGCLGTESKLINCSANAIGVEDCSHFEDVGLVCVSDGDLRLVDSFTRIGGSSGRLEVYYSGQWGTVCDDSFGSSDARVACRQLGFSTSSTPRYGTVGTLGFSQASSSTRTWLDELRCLGTESKLINCSANPIGIEDCSHSNDVALICVTTTPTSSTPSTSFSGLSIGLAVPVFIIIVVGVVLFSGFARRRRRLRRHPHRIPVVNNATSTAVVVTTSNTQNTAYPVQQPMDQKPHYSPQAPPQNMQPAAAYPTGQYTDPQYHTSYPQQPPAPYPTSYPQQPPAPYPTSYPQQPPAPYPPGEQPAYTQQSPAPYPPGEQPAYTQQPPAPYPPGEQPPAQYPTEQPPAQYPTGQPPSAPYLYGGEAPPAYPN